MRTVVDASVAAKWYLPEPGSESAERVLAEAMAGRRELLAPDLIIAEFGSVLWKKVRLQECGAADSAQILQFWRIDRPRLVESELLVERALELALPLGHSVYDCLYLAAAIAHEASLATADTRLARAARVVLPDVLLVS